MTSKTATSTVHSLPNDGREATASRIVTADPSPRSSYEAFTEPPTGAQTPNPLLGGHAAQKYPEEGYELGAVTSRNAPPPAHLSNALEILYLTRSRRSNAGEMAENSDAEAFSPVRGSQGIPPQLRNLVTEIMFVLVCSSGQLLFSYNLGNVTVNLSAFQAALGMPSGEVPWLMGAYSTALGLTVILSGSLADLLAPRLVIVAAFVWLTIWNIVGAFSLTPSRSILFFFMRAMQGMSVGVLVAGSMSLLGRVYSPGQRKTRVFSAMAAMAPLGFFIGALQGGALTAHLPWIFGTNAMVSGLLMAAAWMSVPDIRPEADLPGSDVPSIRDFDWKGAICATAGCICLLFGLTQGSVVHWSPYTYSLIIVGIVIIAAFFWVESKARRPLIPNSLWKTPGFAPLMAAYFLSFGSFVGAWQFFAVQFFSRIQQKSALTVALYLLPNCIAGILAAWIVSKLLHRVPGHYIYMVSMFCYALGPAFFLPQSANTSYWALSLPGITLATFGPDMSFAAASIFITSNVPRSYQGSAGSLLVTIQNLSSAIMASAADSIAAQVDTSPSGEIGLKGLKAAWWFALAAALAGAVITGAAVRIPKEVEKEHVT
ncbi:hypothetical protein LTR95_002676 [Oleoguttula sp. CCFEE 5521]